MWICEKKHDFLFKNDNKYFLFQNENERMLSENRVRTRAAL